MWLALLVFFGCLALSIVSSLVLASGLDRVGARLHFTEGLLGIVTALGADAPEISSAVSALFSGNHDVGLGVVFGSNIFNLAGLLGLSAVVGGQIKAGRAGVLFQGSVAVLVMAVSVALILGALPGWLALVLMVVVLAPYLTLSALGAERVARLPCLPPAARKLVCKALGETHQDARQDQTPRQADWNDALSVLPALASVVLASYGMVQSSVDLGKRWGLSPAIVGMLILATVTSLPNVLAAVRLARKHRATAVLSESLNSNTLNVLAGVCLPAVAIGLWQASPLAVLSMWWMLGMTVVALALACFRGGLSRQGGVGLILLYLAFVAVLCAWRF